ncbi:hypothetical protein SAMN05444959_11685 [Paracoccus seriniphilus]|uniref:Uncharacterized protein n=1 Tax=Paracoccus seriniphilus TaxID=184748 RepID=A0A239Q1B4_9RHOB|nr:hypothetical protein SAMN05444959_11685 [Paracoccus seriniphilus]
MARFLPRTMGKGQGVAQSYYLNTGLGFLAPPGRKPMPHAAVARDGEQSGPVQTGMSAAPGPVS